MEPRVFNGLGARWGPWYNRAVSEPIWRRITAHGGVAVLLIRHAQTESNASKRFCGSRSDPPLDERGLEQAAALGQRMQGQLARIYASPLRRALETARAIAEPVVIDGLRELDQGELDGRDIGETLPLYPEFFRAWQRDPTDVTVPGGESMRALAERVHPAVAQVVRESAGGQVLGIVTHQMAQAAFLCRALDIPLKRWPEFKLRNATANVLAWDGRSFSLLARNV